MSERLSPRTDWASRLLPSLFSYARHDSYVNRLRRRRMEGLLGLMNSAAASTGRLRILDIGGTIDFWRNLGGLPSSPFEILLLNRQPEPLDPALPHIQSVVGDAIQLPFPDHSFDVVFSNSVIEHVGSRENQRRMAAEVHRVGARHIIQTPSLWFPLEPHARLPLFQFVPRSARAWLIHRFRINYFPAAPTYRECLAVSDSTILLTYRDVQRLFPSSVIRTERLLGLPKSYTALHGWPGRQGGTGAEP